MNADRDTQIPENRGETPLEALQLIRLRIATHPEKFTPEEAIDLGVSLIRAKLKCLRASGGRGTVVRDFAYVLGEACFAGDYFGIKEYLNMEERLTFIGFGRGDVEFMGPKDPMYDYPRRIRAIAQAIPNRVAA